jgi:hypothetical protein
VANHARTIPSTRYASIVRVLAIPGYDLSQTVKIQQQLCHSLRQTRCGSHGWTLHSVHGVSQQQQLTCLQQACSLQQLERDHASRPHGYNARHHDAHALYSSQRAHVSTVRPRQTRVVGGAHPKPVRKRVVTCIALHTTLHVNTALAVRCNARAASATDLRARYLAPLARCALLPTLPRRWCTPPCTRRIRSSELCLRSLRALTR